MIERNQIPDRDEVLFAFHQACDRPTARQIAEWTERYPQFADDIRAHASIRCEWANDSGSETLEADDTMLAQGRSRALNILHKVRQPAAVASNISEATWPQMLSTAGFDVPELARHINIDRMVLAELTAGRMKLPIGQRLIAALMDALNVAQVRLENAVSQLLSAPLRLGHAKADQQPTIHSRSYEEIINASTMPDDKKRYWLGE